MCSQGMALRRSFRPQASFMCLLATISLLPCHEVAGQTRSSYTGETSTVDAFGNARGRYPDRRRISATGGGLLQTRQRRSPVRYGRVDRRNALDAASQSNGGFRAMQVRRSQYPHPGGFVSEMLRGNYARYGGFVRQGVDLQAGDIGTAFQRRHALIQATALNAPVHRARIARGPVDMGLPTAVSEVRAFPGESADWWTGFERLGERLQADVTQSHLRIRTEGWNWFRKGDEDISNYRRAARAFKTAVTLDPTDFESRIGEIFSHLSLGAYTRSVVLLAHLSRRDTTLFSYPLNFAKIYADRVHARHICMQCEAYARASGDDLGARALQVFVLWYSGEREQAMIAADALAGTPGEERFADWGAQMRAAAQAPNTTGELP